MTGALAHRGPDADGHWFDSAAGIALGHRRLSIIDLSAAGAQPMISRSGRYVIVFNGEIYNHNDIRKQLETDGKTLSWLGHSDTETLLAAIEAWGLEKTLQNCTGMFAIALWDRTDRKLSLARDRIGEKPLYYGLQNRTFMFGSELKAIRLAPGFRGEIDRDVLALYFQFNAVPDPYCIYRGFHKLRPGCILSIDVSQLRNGTVPEVQPYWSLADVCRSGINSPFIGTDAEAVAKLEKLIAQSIAEQSIADVPLGAFLSGGVDSSAIVAMMQAQSNHRVKTFTIGFTEDAYNEAEHAKAVALHLGTDHHELYVSPQQALDVIPKLPHMYCEPFADSSQIPTFLVSQLARQHVTVSLSGDAGDELFGGYNRYQTAEDYWRRISRTPAPIRGLLVAGIRSLSVEQWNQLIAAVRWVLPSKLKNYANGKRAHVLAELMSQQDIGNFYRQLVTHWRLDSGLVNYQRELPSVYSNCAVLPVDIDGKQRLMAKDILGYLCTDILVKVDRAAMATSLETRVPLLDPRIVEFSQSLPLHLKMRGGQTKWILRELLYKHVPRKLIERPKMGFGVPIGPWLRGPLRDWAENLLSVEKLSEQGLINPDPVRDKWFQHLAGSHNWEYLLWDVLMFQAWLDDQMLTA
jgi:asparagine synthase (glutamine-hydrolysing)